MDTLQPAPAPAHGALHHTWQRLREHSLRHALIVGALSVGIALLLTALDGRGFGTKLVYSVCIGAVCTLVVDAVRLALAAAVDRVRHWQGLPLSCGINGWYGAIAGSLLAVVVGPAIGLWLADQLTGNRSASLLDIESSATRITLLLALLGSVITVVLAGNLERLASARAQAEAAQRQAAEHQLRLLQSQLEPHMLFNTLANLRVLIGVDAARAQAMLDRLIGYLRATLSASRLAAHPLATEFERIDDYLSLMAIRMGPRLQAQLDLPEALRALPVPPLLLQPLVENAIQHGLEPQVAGGRIHVTARREGEWLVLGVADTGVGLDAMGAVPGSRFGLAQVRERLATLHGNRAGVTLSPAPGGGTLALLRFPFPGPP